MEEICDTQGVNAEAAKKRPRQDKVLGHVTTSRKCARKSKEFIEEAQRDIACDSVDLAIQNNAKVGAPPRKQGGWECSGCSAKFDIRKALWEHQRSCPAKNRCHDCHEAFSSQMALREHWKSCAARSTRRAKRAEPYESTPAGWRCISCDELFTTLKNVQEHRRACTVAFLQKAEKKTTRRAATNMSENGIGLDDLFNDEATNIIQSGSFDPTSDMIVGSVGVASVAHLPVATLASEFAASEPELPGPASTAQQISKPASSASSASAVPSAEAARNARPTGKEAASKKKESEEGFVKHVSTGFRKLSSSKKTIEVTAERDDLEAKEKLEFNVQMANHGKAKAGAPPKKEGGWDCFACGAKFSVRKDLVMHKRACTKNNRCRDCGESVSSLIALRAHWNACAARSARLAKRAERFESTPDGWRCMSCDELFASQKLVKDHRRTCTVAFLEKAASNASVGSKSRVLDKGKGLDKKAYAEESKITDSESSDSSSYRSEESSGDGSSIKSDMESTSAAAVAARLVATSQSASAASAVARPAVVSARPNAASGVSTAKAIKDALAEWDEHWSEEYSLPYWHNSDTGESVWEKPFN